MLKESRPEPTKTKKWWQYLSTLMAAIATVFTILGISIVSMMEAPSEPELYIHDKSYEVRGIPQPTAETLTFKNSESLDILLLYLKFRTSRDPEDREATESNFRQIIKREEGISSLETQSHLMTIHGDTYLYHGELEQAIECLVEARRLWRDNPWAAIRLHRAYKKKIDVLLETEPWSEGDQAELRSLLGKIQELEKELAELATVRRLVCGPNLEVGPEGAAMLADHTAVLGGDTVPETVLTELASSVWVADVNTDGYLDVVATSATTGSIAWWPNEGGNGFGPGISVVDGTTADLQLTVVDVDLDGDLDFLRTSEQVEAAHWWENRSGGAEWVARTANEITGAHHFVTDTIGSADGARPMDITIEAQRLNQTTVPPVASRALGDGPRPPIVTVPLVRDGQTVTVEAYQETAAVDGYVYRVSALPSTCTAPLCSGPLAGCDPGNPYKPPGGGARILAIGVDRPGMPGFEPLRYAASDAERVARAFEALGYEAELRLDGTATRTEILVDLTREVVASRPGDDLVVYFSGHGFTDLDGNQILVVHGDREGGGVLPLAEVEAILSHHPGRVTIMLDNCLDRRDVHIDLGISPALLGRNRPNLVTAGQPGRPVIESRNLGGGIFSHTLVEYLERLAATPRAGGGCPGFDPRALLDQTSTATQWLAETLHGIEQEPQLLPSTTRAR